MSIYKFVTYLVILLGPLPLLLSAASSPHYPPTDSFWISLRDTQNILLQLTYDTAHLPQYYSSEIFTQVCETGECKPVRIRLFWDLVGQYLRYEMPVKAILTKMDHIPFDELDYLKFASILSNRASVLEDFNISELSGSKEKATVDQIDGLTGATPKSIASTIVSGAVYTCYTVWHLAHGPVQDSIKIITGNLADVNLSTYLVQHPNQDYQRWALHNIFTNAAPSDSDLNLTLAKINSEDIFIAKYILREIPDTFLTKEIVQRDIWLKYQSLPYALQILVLKRFTKVQVIAGLSSKIAACAETANYEQKQLFKSIQFEN